jgi:hypothetical protein
MQRPLLLLVAAAMACDAVPPPPPFAPPSPALPWLRGFAPAAVADRATPAATAQISRLRSASPEDDYGALELRADLLGDARVETVVASYGFGVAVLDGAQRMIAHAPGLDATGSADDLLALAVGDAQPGAPVIVVASQRGGHRESTVTLTVYRLTEGRALQAVFSAPIELHDGDVTRTGAIVFAGAQLWYRAPGAAAMTPWVLDRARGRYVEHADSAAGL